jgi:osmotically-inducible protein OsmY
MNSVDTPYRDQNIALAAASALRAVVPDTAGFIRAAVQDAWITLTGEVRSWAYKNAAEMCIATLPGIVGITNAIELKRASVRPLRRRG